MGFDKYLNTLKYLEMINNIYEIKMLHICEIVSLKYQFALCPCPKNFRWALSIINDLLISL